jgi:hypothetical protein
LKWHLTTLKTWLNRAARASLETFVTATGGLAQSRANAAANSLGVTLCTSRRAQIIQTHFI